MDGIGDYDDAQNEDNAEGNPDNVRVRIEPSNSSSDFCANYAGHEYTLSEYWDLGIPFPAHVGCVHSAEIITT